jgi:drug/metabolite transporter (DMT)-like permease
VKRSELLTFGLLAAGAASGGGAFTVGKLAVAGLAPATVALLRYLLAVVLFTGLLLAQRKPWPRPGRGDWALIAGMGLSAVAGYNLLFLNALRLAPAAEGGLIVPGSAPVFLALVSAAVFREIPGRRSLVGLGLASAGLAVLFTAGGGLAGGGLSRRLGELLYLAGGCCWAIFYLCARGLKGRVHSLPANAYAAAIGLVVLAPLALFGDGEAALRHVGFAGLAEAGYLAVFATVLLLWANVRGVEHVGATRAAPFAYVAPVAAVLTAAVVLGERLLLAQLVGGALALAGTWLASSRPRVRAKPDRLGEAASSAQQLGSGTRRRGGTPGGSPTDPFRRGTEPDSGRDWICGLIRPGGPGPWPRVGSLSSGGGGDQLPPGAFGDQDAGTDLASPTTAHRGRRDQGLGSAIRPSC